MAVEIRQHGNRKASEILRKVDSNHVCFICGSSKLPDTKECPECGKKTVTIAIPKYF
jgi:rRNA maturation endonuclease Nob1